MGKLNKPIEREFINKNLILNKKWNYCMEKIHQEQLSQINKLMIEKGTSFEDLKKYLENNM